MKCFVIMPIGDPKKTPDDAHQFEHIYTHWIKPAVEDLHLGGQRAGIVCHRADKELRPGEIVNQLIESLSDADVVIADLTGRNPNVFYELGVRHALRNNTIIIAQDLDDIPFDLRGMRAIRYRYDPESLIALKNRLQAFLSEMLVSTSPIDNPVRRFLYEREVAKLMTAPVPPGYDALRQILAEMDTVRKDLSERVMEIRGLVEHSTSRPEQAPIPPEPTASIEGAWTSVEHNGLYIVGRVGSELRGPYCYHSNLDLTAHFYNMKVIDNQVLARFKWFRQPIAGYIMLRQVSNDKFTGGWWYIQDLPQTVRGDFSAFDDDLPSMNRITLIRIRMPKPLPKWARHYFDQVARGDPDFAA